MRNAILLALFAVAIVGCGSDNPTASQAATAQAKEWEAPDLPEKQQELILNRAVELMRESGHWQGYPLQSIGFDSERKQWKCMFSDKKSDAGYAVFIKDENSTLIDILLFPPMWTEYQRKESSNKANPFRPF